MIAGLPWTAWILMIASVGLGLAVEIRAYLSYRRHKNAGSQGEEITTRRSPK